MLSRLLIASSGCVGLGARPCLGLLCSLTLQPHHLAQAQQVTVCRIVIIDWDSAAFTNENGAVRPKWLPEGSSRYLEVPNDHFWAAHTGTPAWAAISQHLG